MDASPTTNPIAQTFARLAHAMARARQEQSAAAGRMRMQGNDRGAGTPSAHADMLLPHRDRAACEISVSRNLGQEPDKPWALYAKGTAGVR